METPIEKRNRKLAHKMIKNLKQRHFDAYYCHTSQEAVNQALQLIPEDSSISWGGSASIRDMGLTKALKKGRYKVYDRDDVTSAEDKRRIYLKAFDCDYYLASANAISEDGEIVNIDGNTDSDAVAPYYTLQGFRLDAPPTQKGLYIRKGKKEVIR